MAEKKNLIIGIVSFILVMAAAIFLYRDLMKDYSPELAVTENENTSEDDNTTEQSSSQTDENDQKAPDFTVITSDGDEIRLSDMLGKPIVINFWASWCEPCKAEMPDFQKAYEKYGDKVEFMMVNLTAGRETLETAKNHIADYGYTFPVYFDTESDAAYAYGVSAIPATYFIDAEGNAKAYAVSMINLELIEQGIGMITENK